MKKKGGNAQVKRVEKEKRRRKREEGREGARESLGRKGIIHKLEEAPQATSRNDRQGEVIVQGAQI